MHADLRTFVTKSFSEFTINGTKYHCVAIDNDLCLSALFYYSIYTKEY
jgi:hypothetical protein